MSLEYALITDSSLPNKIKESDYYVSVDKDQWLDLIDYSENIIEQDDSQKVLFLIVARGTPEQEAADRKLKEKEAAERRALEQNLSEQERLEAEKNKLEAERLAAKQELRKKSKSIFNALYKR